MSPAQSDYALYQKSISYGFVDRNKQKINTLIELIDKHPRSAYIDDAFFELSSAYAVAGSFDTAINTYDEMIGRFPKSPYLPKAILNKGLILYNQEKLSLAESVLKNLVGRFTKDAVAQQALGTLKEIAVDTDKVPQFTQWLKSSNIDTFSDNELEQTAFSAAEKQFLSDRKKQAKKSFISYLDIYPQGRNALSAHFVLAEIYLEESEDESALEHYQKLIDDQPNEYYEQALVRATQILVKQQIQEKARFTLEAIGGSSCIPGKQTLCHVQFDAFLLSISKVGGSTNQSRSGIEIEKYRSKSQMGCLRNIGPNLHCLGDSLKAKSAFKVLEKAPIDKLAAEAYYFRAHQNHKNKDYEKSNEVIALLSQKFSSQPYWAAKKVYCLWPKTFMLSRMPFKPHTFWNP